MLLADRQLPLQLPPPLPLPLPLLLLLLLLAAVQQCIPLTATISSMSRFLRRASHSAYMYTGHARKKDIAIIALTVALVATPAVSLALAFASRSRGNMLMTTCHTRSTRSTQRAAL
jgi:hypothetical protein